MQPPKPCASRLMCKRVALGLGSDEVTGRAVAMASTMGRVGPGPVGRRGGRWPPPQSSTNGWLERGTERGSEEPRPLGPKRVGTVLV